MQHFPVYRCNYKVRYATWNAGTLWNAFLLLNSLMTNLYRLEIKGKVTVVYNIRKTAQQKVLQT